MKGTRSRWRSGGEAGSGLGWPRSPTTTPGPSQRGPSSTGTPPNSAASTVDFPSAVGPGDGDPGGRDSSRSIGPSATGPAVRRPAPGGLPRRRFVRPPSGRGGGPSPPRVSRPCPGVAGLSRLAHLGRQILGPVDEEVALGLVVVLRLLPAVPTPRWVLHAGCDRCPRRASSVSLVGLGWLAAARVRARGIRSRHPRTPLRSSGGRPARPPG